MTMVVYIVLLVSCFRSELWAVAYLPFTLNFLRANRHRVRRQKDGAAMLLTVVDPLNINRDVVALTQLIMGFALVLLRVLAHFWAVFEFFCLSSRCAKDVGRGFPYSYSQMLFREFSVKFQDFF